MRTTVSTPSYNRLPAALLPSSPAASSSTFPPLPPPPALALQHLSRRRTAQTSNWRDSREGGVGRGGWAEEGEGQEEWEDEGDWESADGIEGDSTKASTPGRLLVLSKHPAFVLSEVKHHDAVLVAMPRRDSGGSRVTDVNGTEEVMIERMPLATRIGMRLLYHGVGRGKLLRSRKVEKELKEWSISEGRKFDDPLHAARRIEAFVEAYNIKTDDLLCPSLSSYSTLNRFFYRKLAPGSRPVASPEDPTVISSAADCRITVFESVDEAKRLWIKGQHFSLRTLLNDAALASSLQNGAVAVFRLAPADYHRFHSPVACVVGETQHIPGAYYTVNSMIVRDKHFDVFTSNKRDVTTLHTINPHSHQPVPVAYVEVGALLVASIRQTKKEGRQVQRGEELGYFAYGGSTIIVVFPSGSVEWDEDLLRNSDGRGNAEGVQLETLVKVGEKIGRWVA